MTPPITLTIGILVTLVMIYRCIMCGYPAFPDKAAMKCRMSSVFCFMAQPVEKMDKGSAFGSALKLITTMRTST